MFANFTLLSAIDFEILLYIILASLFLFCSFVCLFFMAIYTVTHLFIHEKYLNLGR